jgi:predicted GNAT family acetyltransferase
MEHGIGYVILQNDEIISGASSYTYCDGRIEITIETREDFRKRGLALACAARLILECLERDIYPRWDAANIASVALAEKLGYRFSRDYGVYSI